MDSLINFLKDKPLWAKILALLAAGLLAFIAATFTGCARSVVAFKGTGELQYIYHGADSRVTIQPE